MNRRLIVRIATALLAVAMLAVPASAVAGKGSKNKDKTLVVCKHGCKYQTRFRRRSTRPARASKVETIKVKPGKYVEGVVLDGKKFNGLTIKGTGKNAEEDDPRGQERPAPGRQLGIANNGIEIDDAKNVTIENMWVRNFATNGVFWRDTNTDDNKNDLQEPGRQERRRLVQPQLRALHVRLRRRRVHRVARAGATATPPTTSAPRRSRTTRRRPSSRRSIATRTCSATPARTRSTSCIKNSNFYNNGVGLVPNTLDSEPFEPTGDSVIKNNNIFWNNFNYFLDASPVQTVSNGLGEVDCPGPDC